jgi:Fic family protein
VEKFINFLNFDFATNQQILKLIAHIDGYKGKWNNTEKLENNYLIELRNIATVASIGSSIRIEGATLSDQEIQTLLNQIKITKLKSRDEQEVVGYFEVLELIYENYLDIHFSESYIKQLHQLLLKHTKKDERHRGKYKSLSNSVVAVFPDGTQKIIFNTTAPALVSSEMQALVEWMNAQFASKSIHPLILIGLLVYEFLSIHPFQYGNGRLSRLLTTLFLLKNEYNFIQYISFENHIEINKKEYYNALMSGQKNRGKKTEKIDQWLIYFLQGIVKLTQKLDQKYQAYKSKGAYLTERQKQLKSYIEKKQPLKVSDIAKRFKNLPLPTLKKDLQYLRQEKQIEMIGQGKGSIYLGKEIN